MRFWATVAKAGPAILPLVGTALGGFIAYIIAQQAQHSTAQEDLTTFLRGHRAVAYSALTADSLDAYNLLRKRAAAILAHDPGTHIYLHTLYSYERAINIDYSNIEILDADEPGVTEDAFNVKHAITRYELALNNAVQCHHNPAVRCGPLPNRDNILRRIVGFRTIFIHDAANAVDSTHGVTRSATGTQTASLPRHH